MTYREAIQSSSSPSTAPRWRKYTVTYSQLSAAGLTNDIEIFQLPAFGVVHAAWINTTVAFSGGVIASYTVSVGVAGNLAKYCTSMSATSATLVAPQQIMGVESSSIATSIRVSAISTVGLLSAATQGSVDVYVLWSTAE